MPDRTFHFTVDNQLLSELGERLVARNYIALAELIKNAYDADAERVQVELNVSAKGGGEIRVSDIGQGMTAADVEKYWMRVATDHKVREPRTTRYGRYKSGSKGIGRFACRRLASRLELKSVARTGRNRFEITTMSFDWRKLVAGNDLAQEPFSAQVTEVDDAVPGVTLTMKGLSERWTQRDFNVLRRTLVDVSISRAEHRDGYKRDPGFEIILTSDRFETSDDVLSEQYMNAGWGRLTTEISLDGIVDLKLKSKGGPLRRLELPDSFPNCKGVAIDIAWIPGEKHYWRDAEVMTNAVRKQLEDTEGGVKVYLEGFRVYPYGDSGTDWLDISRRLAKRVGPVDKILADYAKKLGVDPTRAMLDHPKETTLVGKVVVPGASSKQFIVKMDREGFVENDASQELRRVVQLALQWMTVQYVSFKQKVSEERLADEAAELPLLPEEGDDDDDDDETSAESIAGATLGSPQAALNAALALVQHAGTKGVEALPGHNKSLTAAANVIRRSADVMDAKLARLQILASTGPVVFAFAHEIKGIISRLGTHANGLEGLLGRVDKKHRSQIVEMITDLRETRGRMDQEVELFGVFARSLAEDEPARQSLSIVVKEVVQGFSYLLSAFDIKVDQAGVSVKAKTSAMRISEVYTIVVNLISNALKSCMAGGGKQISVVAERSTDGLTIQIMDTGVGLAQEHWNRVFEPLVSDPEKKIYRRLDKLLDDDLRALGRGSGLGLSIVRDVVSSLGGQVTFKKPGKQWSACVEVTLP
jgi:signal transduction histidine kinase